MDTSVEATQDTAGIVRNVKKLITVLCNDLVDMHTVDRYMHNKHDLPYMPDTADEEYMLLAERATMNWMPLLVETPVQAMYVDGYRPGAASLGREVSEPEAKARASSAWDHWQRSRLDARQSTIYRGAFAHGHAFTLTFRNKKGLSETKGLSPMMTSALFEDAANDIEPVVAFTVTRWAEYDKIESKKVVPGKGTYWDDKYEYEVYFDNLSTSDQPGTGPKVGVKRLRRHGMSRCPVTRFPALVDLEGRTVGLVLPMKPVQDRINQTVFDLLVAQTYGSFQVRWATGMAPPLKKRVIWQRDKEGALVLDGEGRPQVEEIVDLLDDNGRPVPEDVNLNARRFLFAEDSDVKFGAIAGTPLDGYIKSLELSVRQLAALSQTPPHHILGQIANLSAEALEAAETALSRKVHLFKTVFGECWERVFNLAAELDGDEVGANDTSGEVLWRDMEGQGFNKAADALLKLKELEIPKIGLWRRVPGVTSNELQEWEDIEAQNPEQIIASSIKNADRVRSQQDDTQETSPGQDGEDGDLVP